MIIKSTSVEAEKVLESLVTISPMLFQPIEEPVPQQQPKKEMTISELQKALNDHFDAQLDVDGKVGPKTSEAIRKAEAFLKLPVDGCPDLDLSDALSILEGLVYDFTPEVKTPDVPAPDTANHGTTENPDFAYLWNTCTIKQEKMAEVTAVCAKIKANRSRYDAISKETKVPWQVVAVIHKMESNCNFNCHLHNGDPLSARTVQVPAGRPKTGNPPFTFEESAIDALGYDGATGIKTWDIVTTLKFLQKYNGTGYLRKGIYSPYLWSYTNHYTSGKYVKDGVYDPKAVSGQCGAVPVLKMLEYVG